MVSHSVVVEPPHKQHRIVERPEKRGRAAQDTFVSALLEVPCEYKHRNPAEWLLSLTLHIGLIAALLIVPLYFTQTLDLKAFQNTWLVAPAPPPPPPPPAAPMVQQIVKSVARLMENGQLTAPTAIPQKVMLIKEEALPPEVGAGVIGGVPGGVPGGQAGGVLGGILGSTGGANAIAPPPPQVKRIVRIGGDLKPPRQVYAPPPVYPVIAKQAHVEGTVIIDAVIDEHGNVVQAHVLSGPPLLIPSALQAVVQWKYQPTYLNGEAISVAMHVEVHFVLQ
jgi:periplasmic protein TonB